MDVRVTGHQMETGEALQTHVQDRLSAIADKYFSRAISAHVTFGKAPHDKFSCDIVSHVMQGVVLKGRAQANDAHQSFEAAADKIEKQLRRYMRRLHDHHAQAAYAIKEEEAAYTIFSAPDDDNAPDSGEAPVIIAETKVDIPESSVSDAVMMMDLRDTNALFFKNTGTGRHNMVYKREDGTIGWVEPTS